MKKILEFKEFNGGKLAVFHFTRSDYSLPNSLDEMGISYKMFTEDKGFTEDFKESDFAGIIISGGYLNIDEPLPNFPSEIMDSRLPKMGICLGHEILGVHLGSDLIECTQEWDPGETSEVIAEIYPDLIFSGLDTPSKQMVLMNHHYKLEKLPPGSKLIASTKLTKIAGFHHVGKQVWGLQFHPEKDWMKSIVLKNFYKYCLKK